jgi:NAD(P)-dependent dehydrogenase (short-subunit alcohol dehydrogenase family)
MARRLASEGARLALCARRETQLNAFADELRRTGAEVLAVPTDVTQAAALERFAQAATERFGRLDALINNAGSGAAQPFDAVDDAAWAADFELKLFAAIRLTRAALPLLRASRGAVLNILALAAKAPGARTLPSSVTRAAGMALSKALSRDFGPLGVRVNAVLIGIVDSAQWERRARDRNVPLQALYEQMAKDLPIPLGRVGKAEELADLAAFLVSPRAAYITGTAVNFDGGLSPAV